MQLCLSSTFLFPSPARECLPWEHCLNCKGKRNVYFTDPPGCCIDFCVSQPQMQSKMSHTSPSAARRPRVNQPLCERRLPHKTVCSLTTTVQKVHSLLGQIVRQVWAKLPNAIPYWLRPQFLHFDTEWSGVGGLVHAPCCPSSLPDSAWR
jgi:hypothetical protein